ncbi:MAG: N-6 DNA methylase [Nitrospirae bacterium]|nr:N-6 DNA methylase [Nitrospirota bacterium]
MNKPAAKPGIPCPPEVLTLVEHYERNRDAYKSGQYNEAQLRQQFLNPLFEALGWDMANRAGNAEAYKDVVHEDAIKIGQETKAPDYCFRIGGTRKFFLEAKKPSVFIKEDIPAAFQLRRYAWSAKLPLSILCDFEEFAVYDTRIKPDRNDKASTARINYFTYQDYAEKWGEIVSIFSRDAVLRGSFDKYAETTRLKKGTATVDDAFLTEIEDWRELLARNIALRNPDLTQRELNFSVQRTIDRIVFLRICEDRGIEEYGRLQALQNGTNAYKRLVQLFSQADDRYNSGLFHFQKEKDRHEEPDTLTTKIEIDDKPLKDIIKRLYYPESPYEFSVLSADILGQVYEQFLGKVISLTAGHRAKVEEKPEVRKAGGVYYTPKYIVDYIVRNTVGKLVADKKPKDVEKLRILDPACGSGSFLIGAYQYLLDWHQEWYMKDDPKKWATSKNPTLYQAQGGDYRLTTTERKRILLNNIYGVDIDSQAVEVTKLSLLLKVLEGENNQTLQSTFVHERALPDLGDNIKCGNSLIGYDFQAQQNMLDSADKFQINMFDWEDGFSEIIKSGGFDAIIGNPPYLFITELDEVEKKYFSKTYHTCEYRFDVYGLFIELSVKKLLRPLGLHSFIIPHTLLSNDSFEKLRRYLLDASCLIKVIDIGPGVFVNAKNETMVFVVEKRRSTHSECRSCEVILTTSQTFPSPNREYKIDQSVWANNHRAAWQVKISPSELGVLSKLAKAKTHLGDLCTINQGLRTGDNDKYISMKKQSGLWMRAAGGSEIGRYEPVKEGMYVYYEPSVLDAPRKREIFESDEKLVVQEIRNITLSRRIIATYDNRQYFCLQSTNVVNLKPEAKSDWPLKYLLGILNSTLINFFFRNHFSGNNHIASNQLSQISVMTSGNQAKEKLVSLVDQMLSLNKQLPTAKTDHETTVLQRQIDATDRQIDQLVYELYGLTEEEIKIVEASHQ